MGLPHHEREHRRTNYHGSDDNTGPPRCSRIDVNMLEHPLDEGRWAQAEVETQLFQISNLFGDLGVVGSGGKITETLYEGAAGLGLDGSYCGRGRSSS